MPATDSAPPDPGGFKIRGLDDEGVAELHGGLLYRPVDEAVRLIRGSRGRDRRTFMDEASAALQFPTWFLGNWSGFADIFAGMDWLGSDALVLVFTDAPQLLVDSTRDFDALCDVLAEAHQRRTGPRDEPGWQPRRFEVVFLCAPGEEETLAERLGAAGITATIES